MEKIRPVFNSVTYSLERTADDVQYCAKKRVNTQPKLSPVGVVVSKNCCVFSLERTDDVLF